MAPAKQKKRGTKLSDTTGITMLGAATRGPSKRLESFPFHHSENRTRIIFHCHEFSCLCPVTGQPDYAKIDVEYIPDGRAIESKSFKNYLWSFRNEPAFHEDIVNKILNDVHDFLKPAAIRVTGYFNIRGGISIDVVAERGFGTS
ncbi:NADPH-dependent 7-cyano-7-deazaguanine reductase QueF [Candidatus Sumerlaeota bacterium]|nr:NADPH-dependent 7-cyano-7-deazaguanine reductase QueF [Candidatus Sumerlaeota bacterium]